jgi:hypothetical protein
MKPRAVALWVALQLTIGAPLAYALAHSPRGECELAPQTLRDVVLTRASDRPLHRLALQSGPSLASTHSLAPPPDGAGATIELPRAHANRCARRTRFAGPRGPPHVIAS